MGPRFSRTAYALLLSVAAIAQGVAMAPAIQRDDLGVLIPLLISLAAIMAVFLLNYRASCAEGHYLSSSCYHAVEVGQRNLHSYCKSHTGLSGAKKPAQCKFCEAPCRCHCHTQ